MTNVPIASGASQPPVPDLLRRVGAELSQDFSANRPTAVGRAPGRLDVMGGIADYTGSLVCEMPLDRAAAVAAQRRDDGVVQVFSFNLLDDHQPFTLRVPLEALAGTPINQLRADLAEPGRRWAGYLVGVLAVLHDEGAIDLRRALPGGVSLAVLSSVPLGAGVSSSAAIEVATAFAVLRLLGEAVGEAALRLGDRSGEALAGVEGTQAAMRIAALCQRVENQVVGAPCGIMDQVTSCYGREGQLLKLLCQPHEVQGFARLPEGMRVIGLNSKIRHSVGGGMYGRTRCAAFMAHAMILDKMRQMGQHAGRELTGDPLRGYLANLDVDDYKHYFRPYLPELIRGEAFIRQYGKTIDPVSVVDPGTDYHVQSAADHHVQEARRVRQFVEFLTEAGDVPASDSQARRDLLNKAGHLMYASHKSYGDKALLGAEGCDLLVDLVRQNERHGLYGAKITGGGSGGTVAVLCETGSRTDAAIASIVTEYERQTGHRAEVFAGSSAGAWWG